MVLTSGCPSLWEAEVVNAVPQNMLSGKGVTVTSERVEAPKPIPGQHGEARDRVWGTYMRHSELFAAGGSWGLGSDARRVDCEGRSN